MGAVNLDHPDPSIYTVMTFPTDTPGIANVDFLIFPPRWQVANDTFRPPPYHRNVMSEFMGLVKGVYEVRPNGFLPGGASLHNCMLPHGPEADVFERGSAADLEPAYLSDTLAVMFETKFVLQPSKFALDASQLDVNYADCWAPLKKNFSPNAKYAVG